MVYIVEASALLIPFSENLSHHPPRKLIFRGKRTWQACRKTGTLAAYPLWDRKDFPNLKRLPRKRLINLTT